MFFKRKKMIAVHNGEFHADDVFAVATLTLVLGDSNIEVVRTRDMAIIEKADIVADVGGIYDPAIGRFDHHQTGGADLRTNNIPYAAFGLVWRKYGQDLCGSKRVADSIDERLVQPIDAIDNGVSVSTEIFAGVRPFDISTVIGQMNPTWKEDMGNDKEAFLDAVSFAVHVLKRIIKHTKDSIEAETFMRAAYERADDKRLIVLNQYCPAGKTLVSFTEPLFVVYPNEKKWLVKAVRKSEASFENRKNLPQAWAGKRDAELSAITGVPGSIFCHNKLFVAVAETKEAALKLAHIALEA